MRARSGARAVWTVGLVAAVALGLSGAGCDKVKELVGAKDKPSPAPAAAEAPKTGPSKTTAPTKAATATAPTGQGEAKGPTQDSALRDKLKALAVASQCMQKAGKTSEEMAQTMFAQYKAFGVSLEQYTTEMAKLAGDKAFQAEIRAAVAECPGPAPKVAAVDTGATAKPADANAKPADTPAKPADANAKPTDTPAKPADANANPGPKPADANAKPADTSAKPADSASKPKPKPTAPSGGTFKGSVSGSARGSITVSIRGTKASGSASVGATQLKLHGRYSKGTVRLQGRAGNDYARFTGKLKGKKLSGAWQGTVVRRRGVPAKRSSGAWNARRR